MAERQGFEPWIPCGIHAFQACAFSHSAISPQVCAGQHHLMQGNTFVGDSACGAVVGVSPVSFYVLILYV